MKRFLKATKDLGDRQQTIKKYVLINDQPQEVSHDSSQVQVQASSEVTSSQSKQGSSCEIDRWNESLTQATRTAAHHDKEKATRDRAWIKHAYLQSTLPQNQLDDDRDTDTLETVIHKEKSKQQIESKTDVALITKKLTMSLSCRSPDSISQSAANYFIEERSAVDSPIKSANRVLKELKKSDSESEVEAADLKAKFTENKKTKVPDRSVKRVIKLKYPQQVAHKNCSEVEMQVHLMDSAERNTDHADEITAAELKAKSPASQKEDRKAPATEFNESTDICEFKCLRSDFTKSSTTVAMITVEAMKETSMEDHSLSNSIFREHKETPNQMSDEFKLKSSEHKSFTECHRRRVDSGAERSLNKRDKVPTICSPNKSERESVKMEHHHLAQCRKDHKSKSALPLKLDNTSNKAATSTKQDKRVRFKVESGEKPNTWREIATPTVAIEITREGKLDTNPPIESSNTARTKNSVEERSLEENERERVGTQTRKVKRKAHNRSTTIIKYPHQSFHKNGHGDRDVQLHSDNKSKSTNDVHSTAQKDENATFIVDMGESKEKSKRQLPKRDNLKEKVVQAGTAVIPVKSKPSSSITANRSKYKKDANSEAKTLDCELVITHAHNRQRGWNTKQKSAEVNDPELVARNEGARKENKGTTWQRLYPSSKVSSTNTSREDSVKQKWNQRGNHKRGDHQTSRDKVMACGDQDNVHLNERSEPKLPERGYLEDIDFVVNEFDMIFRANPELPARAYLEDIDFVSKEFDLFFKRKPRHQEKQKASTCSNGANETLKFVPKDKENPRLNSDEATGDQHGASMSASNTYPWDHHQPLLSNKLSNPGDVYINHSLSKAPHTSTSQWETDSSKGQYQPLITSRQDPRTRHDLVAFRPFRPLRSPLQETTKSQKILKEDQDVNAAIKSMPVPHPRDGCVGGAKNSHINFQSPSTSDCNPMSDHHHPVYVNLNINPQQPCTSEVSASNATDLGDGPYQPLHFNRQKDPETNHYMRLTPLTLSTETAKPDTNFSGKYSSKSTQFPSTSMSTKSHGKCRKSADCSNSLKVNSAQVQTVMKTKKKANSDYENLQF